MTGEGSEDPFVEHVRDEPHVLDDRDELAVAHRHTGRLLAPVLERIETEIGEVRDRLAVRMHPEHAACFFRRVVEARVAGRLPHESIFAWGSVASTHGSW